MVLFTGETKIDGIVNHKVHNCHWENAKLCIEEQRIKVICKECGITFWKTMNPTYATLNQGEFT